MKKVKRAAAATVAAFLCMGMAATAFAADESPKTLTDAGSATIGVTGSYDGTVKDDEPVYKIDIAWGSMAFTYETNVTRRWNTTTHQYETSDGTGLWEPALEGISNKITVTNHSNAAVNAALSFTEAVAGITGKFTDGTNDVATLALASAGTTNAAVVKDAYFEITGGTLDNTSAAGTSLGTITVAITK